MNWNKKKNEEWINGEREREREELDLDHDSNLDHKLINNYNIQLCVTIKLQIPVCMFDASK
jgi:hypothetical protein